MPVKVMSLVRWKRSSLEAARLMRRPEGSSPRPSPTPNGWRQSSARASRVANASVTLVFHQDLKEHRRKIEAFGGFLSVLS